VTFAVHPVALVLVSLPALWAFPHQLSFPSSPDSSVTKLWHSRGPFQAGNRSKGDLDLVYDDDDYDYYLIELQIIFYPVAVVLQ
jgi:hypothetical protein